MFDKGQKQSSTLSCDSSYLKMQDNGEWSLISTVLNSMFMQTFPVLGLHNIDPEVLDLKNT